MEGRFASDRRRTPPGRLAPLALALALALASVAFFGRAIAFDFVSFDDRTVLLAHPELYDEGSLLRSLDQIFRSAFPREEPLLVRDLSWAIDARLFGHANPLGYHLGNVLLNAANVALLFLFLAHATRRRGFALAVAGVFAVLPIHVEPVSWVMGRKDVLSACFALAALLAQSHELSAASATRRRVLWLVGLVCTGLALFSKISAVALCGVLLVHRVFRPYLTGERAPDASLAWGREVAGAGLRLAPHFALCLGAFLWYHAALSEYGVLGLGGPSGLDPFHLGNVARFAPLLIGLYLRSIFWPGELSAAYRWPHVEIPLSSAEAAAALAIAVGIAGAVVWCLARRRDLAFWVLAFGALVVPYLGFEYVGFWRADRYIYLSSFAVLALAVLGLESLARRLAAPRAAVAVAIALFATVSGAQAWQQQAVWRDSESLWGYEASRREPSLLALQALGRLQVEKAEAEADPEQRAEWIRRARAVIERGIAGDAALGRIPGPYATYEPLHLSRLHALRGRIALLEGGSPLEHYARAYELAPDRGNAMRLAGSYYDLAHGAEGEQRQALMKLSLAYFGVYARYSEHDPTLAARSRRLLAANYDETRFPFLADELRHLRREIDP